MKENNEKQMVELFEVGDIIQNEKKIMTLSIYVPKEILLKYGRISCSRVTQEGKEVIKEFEPRISLF